MGTFDYAVDVDPRELAQGDLITVTRTIDGKGWLNDADLKPIDYTDRFRAYPPRELKSSSTHLKVSQTVVALSTNAMEIPASEFIFFDPLTASYKTGTQGPFSLSYHNRETVPPRDNGYHPPASTNRLQKTGSSKLSSKATGMINPRLIPLFFVILAGIAIAMLAGISLRRIHPAIGFTAGALVTAATAILAIHLLQNPPQTHTKLTTREETARIAPSPGAVIQFIVPRNTNLEILETTPRWARIRYREQTGWIYADALKQKIDNDSTGKHPQD